MKAVSFHEPPGIKKVIIGNSVSLTSAWTNPLAAPPIMKATIIPTIPYFEKNAANSSMNPSGFRGNGSSGAGVDSSLIALSSINISFRISVDKMKKFFSIYSFYRLQLNQYYDKGKDQHISHGAP